MKNTQPRLTDKRLRALLMRTLPASMDQHEREIVAKSVKVGKAAEQHTGHSGTIGYFATEGTIITSYYYDAPTLFWEFCEGVTAALRPFGLMLELKNSCEHTIHPL